jgi:non-specific protein-tyrosine kinase
MNEEIQSSESNIRTYLAVLRRRRWMILSIAILATVAAVAVSARQKSLYEGSAQVLLSRQDIATAVTRTPDPSTNVNDFSRVVETQAVVARSPAVARNAIQAAHAAPMTAEKLLSNSDVTAQQNVDVLDFTVRDGKATRAAALATAYANEFIAYRRSLDTAAISRALKEVNTQLAQLRAQRQQGTPLYANLSQNQQQLQTLQTLQTSNAALIKPAALGSQVQPKPLRNAVLALLLGALLGTGLAFLREALDTRLRSPREIGEKLGLPLLASLPAPPRKVRREHNLVTLEEPTSPGAESFRMLRTGLDFANLERRARTIMVTSAVEKEGKSTTAANLAVTLTQRGWRVVLVDFDLRRPFIHRFFGLDLQPGLTDVALGSIELEDALAKVPVPSSALQPHAFAPNGHGPQPDEYVAKDRELEVLTAGTLPPSPGDFVNMPLLAGLVRQLRERADLVLVDVPPMLHVDDALSLSAIVDGILLVTRMNLLRRPLLRELGRHLETSRAPTLGYVVTDVDVNSESYGYAGRYYMPQRELINN